MAARRTPAPESTDRFTMTTIGTLMKDIENAADNAYYIITGTLQVFKADGDGGLADYLGKLEFTADGGNVARWTR